MREKEDHLEVIALTIKNFVSQKLFLDISVTNAKYKSLRMKKIFVSQHSFNNKIIN